MALNLSKILKALLLSTSEPLSIRDIQGVFTRYHEQKETYEDEPAAAEDMLNDGQAELPEILEQVPSLLTATQIREAMDTIERDLEANNEVYRLVQGPWGYKIATAPKYALWIRLLRKEERPQRLSQAAMETLSIIAYRQPITRAEIEAIRGVSVDSGLRKLTDLELISIMGRADLPGRPIQYGTAEKFLEYVGLKSIEELPASDVLSSNQVSSWLKEALQKDKEELSEKDVGLPEANHETDT